MNFCMLGRECRETGKKMGKSYDICSDKEDLKRFICVLCILGAAEHIIHSSVVLDVDCMM